MNKLGCLSSAAEWNRELETIDIRTIAMRDSPAGRTLTVVGVDLRTIIHARSTIRTGHAATRCDIWRTFIHTSTTQRVTEYQESRAFKSKMYLKMLKTCK